MLIRARRWHLPEAAVTDETAYWRRRAALRAAGLAGLGAALTPLSAWAGPAPATGTTFGRAWRRNAVFDGDPGDAAPTPKRLVARYNNFYEFGGDKTIHEAAQALPTVPWRLEIGGLVARPQVLDLDDLRRQFPLEERIYRFRCVEAWAMTVPWLGYPMHRVLRAAEPRAGAKYVRFTSFYDKAVTPGPGGLRARTLPWPYREGLRLDEAMHELAFLAVGLYGKPLPKQNGAPVRCVIPWKYGFKGAKSVVKIELVAEQPATFWHTLAPHEYGFGANVDPAVPHPRWSQRRERVVSRGPALLWPRRPTLPYNGYAEYVARLYR